MPGGGGYSFNPSAREGRGRRILELEVSLIYRVSSRAVKVTRRNPILKNKRRKIRERDGQTAQR